MEWTKVYIKTTTLGVEAVTGVLLTNGISGMEIIDPGDMARQLAETMHNWDYADESLTNPETDETFVVFYATKDEAGTELVDGVRRGLLRLREEQAGGLGELEIHLEFADDEDWLHEWKKHFKPLRIGRVVIVPEWESYRKSPGDIVFTIDPGSAFGTGQHQTTQLCLAALQEHLRAGDSMLDIGCGSGILSVVGLLLGAEEVFACDIDPAGAMASTKKNIMLNPVDEARIQIHAGDVLAAPGLRQKIRERRYDIVAANIVADVIIALAPFAVDVLKPGGFFIASGIISERADEVFRSFSEAGLEIARRFEAEGWHCIVGRGHV